MRRSALQIAVAILVTGCTSAAGAAEIVRLRVDDTIQPASQQYLERGLEEARERGAELVVVELDTPGGLMTSMREMTTAITSSDVPVVVYVTPAGAQAASAGFFLLMAADVAAMAPGTNTGAAHPVGGEGENLPDDVRTKATNDAAAMIRSFAVRRGRNPELAERAVTESLSFSADEAFEQDLVEVVADDLDALLELLDGTEVARFTGETVELALAEPRIVDLWPSRTERVLSVLANPNIAYILMAIGMLGLYLELSNPGAILPGVVGVLSLLLAFYSLSVLPVNLVGVALIAVALGLFLLEVKVASYGLLTAGGLISFVLGSLMLFDAPIPNMRVSLGVVLPTALVIAAAVLFVLTRVVAVHRTRPTTGADGLVGEVGTALTVIGPAGKVRVHGEYWDATVADGEIPAGARVRVVRVTSRYIEVEPAEVGRRSA